MREFPRMVVGVVYQTHVLSIVADGMGFRRSIALLQGDSYERRC
jgi:hypothetical protein